MSRRKRKTGVNGTNKQRSAAPVARSGYDGANISEKRGYIHWPTLDTRKELDTYDRGQLIRKARWLYANTGVAQRVVDGLANMVGHLTPQAATSDEAWNDEVEALFSQRAGHAPTFDRAAKVDFYGWQNLLTRLRLKDGDCLSVLTESPGGFAQVIQYEAHQIDNGDEGSLRMRQQSRVRDGVISDKFGRPLRFRIVNMDDLSKWAEVPARDCIFHVDYKRAGQVRGVTSLAHAINHLLDRTEVFSSVKHAIKTASQLGYLIENGKVQSGVNPLGQNLRTPVKTDNGTTINLHDILESSQVPNLEAGQSVKVLHDARPHPNQQTFLEELIRDIAWGVGVSPEIIWRISGLTGPATRYVMAELERWIEGQQALLQRACQRYWVYFVAKEINAGRLRMPSDSQWWKCEWLPQGSLTIDKGREGNLQLAQLQAGAITKRDLYANKGQDWEAQTRQRIKEVELEKALCAEHGLEWSEVFGGKLASNNQPQQTP